MNNTKEQIKSRMLKNAASQWGIPANEIEMSFDPVISLLLSACASEIEKISDKINESQTRVTEKIIQLMTPETIFGPKPSHAIMRTHPSEDEVRVDPNFLFSFKKKDVDKASSRFKDISLKDVAMYFELQDLGATTLFYHHLKNAKWFVGEKEIKIEKGLGDYDGVNSTTVESLLNEDSLKVANIVDQVRNNYSRYFITVKEDFMAKKEVPEAFKGVVEENSVEIDENTIWIKIVFPRVINASIIQNIYCNLNSFPVMNRKIEEFSYQLKEFVNVVPVMTTSLFLDVKSITNLDNKKYKLLNKNISDNEKGVYAIKTDNIKKIDSRKAKDYVVHLIELLKDESASFSYLNNDFLQTNLKQLNQIISLLENKIASTVDNEKIETNYISIEPYRTKDTLMISYWVTDGGFANNIKYGSSLKNYKSVGLQQKSSFLMTSTYGGRDSLNMQERLQAYRRTLLSRDKIVTKEDVRLACFEFFGDKIKEVEVKNGYTIDVSLNKGMVNCIEIWLKPNSEIEIDPFEWDFIKNNLLLFLEQKATAVFPFVIKNS